MTPHLRDWFAAHIAAALAAEQRLGVETIAARAYDVADALIAERDQRLESEISFDTGEADEPHGIPHLLDDALPYEEKDDDAWVREAEERASFLPPASDRPGLARTQLELPLEIRTRKTGA